MRRTPQDARIGIDAPFQRYSNTIFHLSTGTKWSANVVARVETIPKSVLVALPDGVSLVAWRRTKLSNMAVDKDIAAM